MVGACGTGGTSAIADGIEGVGVGGDGRAAGVPVRQPGQASGGVVCLGAGDSVGPGDGEELRFYDPEPASG